MSPVALLATYPLAGFPRVSGDEPGASPYSMSSPQFSPRERG